MSEDRVPPIVHNTVFVGNLEFSATEQDLLDLFSQDGGAVQAHIARDRGGNSRGHGFVQMKSESDVISASTALNNQMFQGRSLTVTVVRNRMAVFPWNSPPRP